MAISTDPMVHDGDRDRQLDRALAGEAADEVRVSWGEDPYAEAELQRRAERTRTMIEKARRQLL